MRVDLQLKNAFVYDVTQFQVMKGEDFTLHLVDAPKGVKMDWFSNNDPVLDIFVDQNTAGIVAGDAGISSILLMSSGSILKELTVHVKEEIVAPAVTLGITVDDPEPK